MTLARALALALAAALLQIGVLAYGIHKRAVILRDGAEVTLKTVPVDPRDLLRGRYVQLGFDIARLPRDRFDAADRDRLAFGEPVRVHLVAGPDGLFVAEKAALGRAAAGADRTWILGTVTATDDPASVSVDYGIERFYAPEYLAPEIERNMRDGELTHVVVAIGADGTAQIKALRQGESVLYTEPLY